MKTIICGSSNNYIEHNGSGYRDDTVDDVIKHEREENKAKKEEIKYIKLKRDIKKILVEAGYILDGPISLINIDNGKKRRIY